MARPKLTPADVEIKEEKKADLAELSTAADSVLNGLVAGLSSGARDEQKEEDAESDFEDSEKGRRLRAKFEKLKAEIKVKDQMLSDKGLVLASGQPQFRKVKEAIEPGRIYNNFPVATIDDKPVRFVSSRPFYDKQVSWDDGFRQSSEHFIQCDHPIYTNAVYCHIPKFVNFDKALKEAYVIRTDEEIQLYFVD